MVNYLRSMWVYRYFLLSLVGNDLRARYRRTVLGLGWSLLNPVLMTSVICFALCAIFHHEPEQVAPTLFAGLTIWNFISGVTQQGCNSILHAECYIRQHRVPMAIYPLRIVLAYAFHFVIGLLPVMALSAWFNGWLGPLALLSLVPSLALLLVLGWAIATLMGMLNVWFRDTRHLIDILLQVIFYLTPIIYTPDQVAESRLAVVMRLNPLVPFLNLFRETILHNQVPSLTKFGAAALAAVVCASLAGILLWKQERQLIFYL